MGTSDTWRWPDAEGFLTGDTVIGEHEPLSKAAFVLASVTITSHPERLCIVRKLGWTYAG